MRLDLTYGAYRVLTEILCLETTCPSATDSASVGINPDFVINPASVLLHLLDETECRAACWLKEVGITPEMVRDSLNFSVPESAAISSFRCFLDEVPVTLGNFTQSLAETILAVQQRCHLSSQTHFATEHLLFALTLGNDETAKFLQNHGIDSVLIHERITVPDLPQEEWHEPIVIHDFLPQKTSTETLTVHRILDAAANRAVEGIRVVEDYLRFGENEPFLCAEAKNLRHELAQALLLFPEEHRLAFRNTTNDVGTVIEGEQEYHRSSPEDVLRANFSRFQESLRSLEEYGKVVSPDFSRTIEQLRYRSYTLQKMLFHAKTARNRLLKAELYVLVDARNSEQEFLELVRAVISGGADLIQLREKNKDDQTLLARAKLLKQLTRSTESTETLFIMNDRPDIALLAKADGVHLGQDELPVHEVRTLVGAEMLIGLSTHSIEQARDAMKQGVDYIGVGPVFPSRTKSFEQFPGLELLKQVAAEISIPAFAIGGIDRNRLDAVSGTGITRIAVQNAVCDSDSPEEMTRSLKGFLSRHN